MKTIELQSRMIISSIVLLLLGSLLHSCAPQANGTTASMYRDSINGSYYSGEKNIIKMMSSSFLLARGFNEFNAGPHTFELRNSVMIQGSSFHTFELYSDSIFLFPTQDRDSDPEGVSTGVIIPYLDSLGIEYKNLEQYYSVLDENRVESLDFRK